MRYAGEAFASSLQPARRHSRRPFERVRRMRRKPPVLTLAMTRFMAREHFPAGKGISQ
jgi:hypothetical protein